ncbi:MAG: glycosyl hydrolase [Planctomycetota bacterium]
MVSRSFLVAVALFISPLAIGQESLFDQLHWREIGPYRGGRSAAVAGIPSQGDVYYFGATGGGVWKTRDGGRSWRNVSDGYFGGSIGAVAVSEADPNVVYVGGGEKTLRGNVSHGDGVWRSTDAGRTWKRVGLEDTRHVPRIRIHPRDPDVVYVAALGHLFGPNHERGVFRSRDGGESWEHVLFVDENTGAVDLILDPTNPRILYATFWQVKRTPYSLESGGDGSGLWKSTDGGDSWVELTDSEGLPKGPLGISGITVSPSNPDNLYAIIEAEKGGVFRSRDAGETWSKTNDERSLRQRAWYYTRLYADPADEESVYVLNVRFWRSKDGGKSFSSISVPHGDNHDLWIDPNDPLRMIQSNDGGANVTLDGGETWTQQDTQPTAQMYRVSTDNDFPYRLLGGQQDNSTVRIRSRSLGGSIGERDWEPSAGGESGHVVAKPDDPDIVYGGSYGGYLTRVDHRTGEARSVHIWPDNPMGWGAADLKYRFQWNFPIFFSPHDPNTLYAAAQVLFRSKDEGQTWEAISPDLTRNDKSKQGSSGGLITQDNTSVEYYGTIFAAAESPIASGVLWTGSDDGLVHVSMDDGQSWKNVTPPEMPEWTMINSLEPHPTEKAGLYFAGTRYKLDDFEPYLYRTLDWGETWTRIDAGIDRSEFTRVVRADPERPGLLYTGTERGVWVSFDDGGAWTALQGDLPIVPVTDLAVKDGELIAATQGRGFWILSELDVVRGFSEDVTAKDVHLFEPQPIWRVSGGRRRGGSGAGENPPAGVALRYHLSEVPAADTPVSITILDGAGVPIREFTRKPEKGGEKGPKIWGDDDRVLEPEAGLNRFEWDLRYPSAEGFDGMVLWNGNLDGPRALPGKYQARLVVGDTEQVVAFEIRPNPLSSATADDLQAQFDFIVSVRDKLTEIHRTLRGIRDVKSELSKWESRLEGQDGAGEVRSDIEALKEKLSEAEKALYQTQNKSRQDPLNFPIRLNDKLAGVGGQASFGDFRPTRASYQVRDELFTAIDEQLAIVRRAWREDLPALNRQIAALSLAPIELPEPTSAASAGEGGGQ